MTNIPSSSVIFSVTVLLATALSPAHGLGSSATIAVNYGSGTVCGIIAFESNKRIACYRGGTVVSLEPYTSFSAVSGGRSTLCGLRSGGYSLLCWDDVGSDILSRRRRVYLNGTDRLTAIAIGDDQVCGLVNGTGAVKCPRGGVGPIGGVEFDSISGGIGFSCGIVKNTSRVRCWGGSNGTSNWGEEIENQFVNTSMRSIVAGGSHACGFSLSGPIVCKGSNSSEQLNPPSGTAYSSLALGENHSCAVRQPSGSVVCWGGGGVEYSFSPPNATAEESFVSIVAGLNFTCGLLTRNLSILCWGPGWPVSGNYLPLPLPTILPGPCVKSSCSDCGIYDLSESLCSGLENICKTTDCPPPPKPPSSAPSPESVPSRKPPSRALSRGLLAFGIVGSVGCFIGISTVLYCLWAGVCFGNKKIHNSVQPTITGGNSNPAAGSNSGPPSRSSSLMMLRQGSRIIRRQRSGTSSLKHHHPDNRAVVEEFLFSELAAATDNFSPDNKIGAGSFGMVYRGKLSDGREVAIKRGEIGGRSNKFQEKESAFESELSFLSRLHHKHLVRLVGFCEEKEERLLVYDRMKNGALYDHLHGEGNAVVNSWKMRIKISLDAARGIEYLHNYAHPPIIHRDIKSSNILLDSNWTARVSDFGLSLMGPTEAEAGDPQRPTKAAGTVGYIDPEYYGLNMITAKSDVYGLGVVLLELLTGKRAIFRDGGEAPVSIVDYAVPMIMAGEVSKVLDPRVEATELNQAEAVELVAYTAMLCVNLEGRERPSITDIVANLERALDLCDHHSHGSISSGEITIAS